jgi:hypothetical protein
VELAQRSLALALNHRAALVLCGEGDMVPIAQALRRRTLGPDTPLIVCDPRRLTSNASVRSAASRVSGIAAFEAAIGGSLCGRQAGQPSGNRSTLRGAEMPGSDVACRLVPDGQVP